MLYIKCRVMNVSNLNIMILYHVLYDIVHGKAILSGEGPISIIINYYINEFILLNYCY